MAETHDLVTLDEVLELARRLSPIDKVRLIERIAPEVERDPTATSEAGSRSLLGLLKDFGRAPSADDIDAARREAWTTFPRDDT